MVTHPLGPDTHRRYGALPACRHCPDWDWTLEDVFDAPHGELAVFRCRRCQHLGTLRLPAVADAGRDYRGAFDV